MATPARSSLLGKGQLASKRQSVKRRRLEIQTLQSREMMAADCCSEVTEPTAEIVSAASSSAQVASADAGSTLGTALDLGTINRSTTVQGSVNFADRLDIYRFEVSGDGVVDVDLTGLSRNVDLVFADESGSLIDSSRNSGRASESITASLDAGTYYVGVQTRSFWGSRYELSLDVQLEQPDLGSDLLSPLAPLSDVAYFGGSREWNLNAVNAPEAWAAGYSGEGITIAVVDTGVDLDHPDLAGNLFVNAGEIEGNGIDDDGNGYVDDVHGYDFAAGDADPNDVGGHGTHVAGTIAAGLNGFGATGVAPDATILPVRVLGDNGSGSTNAVAAGIRYAAEQGADIINLSLGGGFSRAIQSAIDYAQDLGSFIVAAAGNEAASTPGFPARFSAIYDNVLSVGAHDSRGQIAGFSNDVGGSGAVQVDAPGVGVFSTYVGGRYANLSGTSMAAPHVAGVAALALSANPDLTPSQLRDLLVGGTTASAIGSDASGIVNAATTVAFAAAGLTASPLENGSASLAANGNASTYRTTTLDTEIVDDETNAPASDFLVAAQTDVTTAQDVVQESSTIDTTAAQQELENFHLDSRTEVSTVDLAEVVTQQNDPEPAAIDVVLGVDFLDSLV